MSRVIQRNLFNSFLILPFTVLTIGPGLHDVNGFPKLFVVVLGTFLLVSTNLKSLKINNKVSSIPWLILLFYGIIQLINPNNLITFLLGAYLRNGGFISLVCFALIFTVVSNLSPNKVTEFKNVFLLTIYGLIIYAGLDLFNLLPWEMESNYQKALVLTLTNPNFTSAFLGIACSGLLVLLDFKNRSYLILQLLVFATVLFMLFLTQSLQGFLILISSLIILIFNHRVKFITLVSRFKKSISLISLFLLFFLFTTLGTAIDWLTKNGSIEQRLSYWRLSIKVWRDHFFTGVGLDNLRPFSTTYRDLDLVKQEGIFSAPDRSHNVVLDHFVNGGLFTGILWLSFILIISFLAIKNLFSINHEEFPRENLLVIVCWFGYLIQSFISVDHLALTVLGYISGGFIVSYRNQSSKNLANLKILSAKKSYLVFGCVSLLFICSSLFAIKITIAKLYYMFIIRELSFHKLWRISL